MVLEMVQIWEDSAISQPQPIYPKYFSSVQKKIKIKINK